MAMLSEVASVLLLPLVLAFLFLVGRGTKKQEEGCKPKLPPGPPRLPVIGNLHQLGKCPHQTLHQLSKQYGPLMLLRLGDVPTVVISSAEIAEQVLKTHDLVFCSRATTTTLSRLSYNLSDVVASPYNAKWRELRKIVLHKLLSPKMVEGFRPVREEEIERMISSISHLSSLSEPVNLAKSLTLFTNNVISRVAFGKIFHSEGSTDQKNGFQNLLMKSEAMFSAFFARDYFAWAGWVDVLSGQRARLGKTYTELDAFYQKVIAEHENPMRNEEKEDIVDVLLRLQKEDNHLTQDQVKGVLMNVLLAGTHTTSITLEYAMAELMRNPSVMLKAQKEVRRVVGNKGKVDESDISQLYYLKLVMKETLRLHPVLPFLIPREAMGHVKINEYDVFPKTRVYVNAWAIGRDPDSWDQPDEFIPERFVGSAIDFRGLNYQFLPFGAGRRICPGLSFSIITMELALANLLYIFDWELPDDMIKEGIDMDEISGVATRLKTNLRLQATKHAPHVGKE